MDNLSAHDVAARIQDQAENHDDVVKAQFPELPYNSVQTLTTVNTSLADKNLAVSLVGFLYNTYKSEADVKKFVNRMYITIFGDSASQKLQWRSAFKTNDKRSGIANMLNILAVFGTSCNMFTDKRSLDKFSITNLVQQVKNCRKARANEYRKLNNIDAVTAAAANLVAETAVDATKDDTGVVAALDKLITKLEKAVGEFKIPRQ
ncbi:uncharacterized protein LOC123474133 [Daphnia magna]|uniref:Coat protein n=1 Tax=Daphnia magna TaxID=35525 RepID=A0ABR0ASV6_9CRUS|nr:uncharacterized protein LOC123474133 [Daphnia magna]KAK4028203.1 hypothetical protein OUZ56_017467 [Daphnia magna]